MNIKTYGTVRCCKCEQDLTDKIQIYDYVDKEQRYRATYCEQCNSRIKDSYKWKTETLTTVITKQLPKTFMTN